MKTTFLPYLTAGAVVVGVAFYASHLQHAQADEAQAEALTTHVAPNQLRYPAGSPQLAYLAIQSVAAEVPPLLEPLPARIALDEDHTVRVFSPVAGRTVQVVAQPGQRVRAGDVLAWLFAPDYDTAVADLRKAQAEHDGKQSALQRAQRLSEAGVIATRELELAQTEARSSQAEVARAGARIKALGHVASDGRFALRAPLDGVVAERHLNPGQELRPDAADPAFVITDPAFLDVVADVAESELSALHVGQPIRVEADGIGPSALQGRIATVGLALDASTRRVAVRAHLVQPPASVRPDMFVRLAPLDEQGVPAATVPNSALVTTGVQSFVFVEPSAGLLVKRPVVLAHRGRDVSHVLQGLKAGERVVTKGAILLDAEMASDN